MLVTPHASQTFDPTLTKNLRIALICSQFNEQFTAILEKKCRETLLQHGVPEQQIKSFAVPGALEIPVVAQKLAQTQQYDVLIALGLVLKGDTYHFELVANECARGCMDISIRQEIPVIMEVLAAYSLEQAAIRCGDNDQNKGIEAALVALGIAATLQTIA